MIVGAVVGPDFEVPPRLGPGGCKFLGHSSGIHSLRKPSLTSSTPG